MTFPLVTIQTFSFMEDWTTPFREGSFTRKNTGKIKRWSFLNVCWNVAEETFAFTGKNYIISLNKKWYTNQRVPSSKLFSLRVALIARVTSYFLCANYELRFSLEFWVNVYCTSYELLLIYESLVTIYCTSCKLLYAYELRVTFHCQSYELLLAYKLLILHALWIPFYIRVMS